MWWLKKQAGYYIERQETPVAEEEQLIFDGISDERSSSNAIRFLYLRRTPSNRLLMARILLLLLLVKSHLIFVLKHGVGRWSMDTSNTSNTPVYQPLGSSIPSESSENIKPVKPQTPEKTGFFKKMWRYLMKKTDKEKAIVEATSHALQKTATHQTASPAKHHYKTLSHTAQADPAQGALTSRTSLSKAEIAKANREAQLQKSIDEEVRRSSSRPSTPQTGQSLSREEVQKQLIEKEARLIKKEATDRLKAPTAPPTPFTVGRPPPRRLPSRGSNVEQEDRSRESVQAKLIEEELSRLRKNQPAAPSGSSSAEQTSRPSPPPSRAAKVQAERMSKSEETLPPLPPRPQGAKQPTKPPPLATERDSLSLPREKLSPLGQAILDKRDEERLKRDERAARAKDNQRAVNEALIRNEPSKLPEPTQARPPPPSKRPGKLGA